MTDHHITADLEDYLDERLSAADRSVVDAHLVECSECRTELEAAQKLRTVLSVLPVAGPRPGFLETAMQRAQEGSVESAHQQRARAWMPAALAAGIVVMLVGGLLLRQPGTDGDVTAPPRVAANITMAVEEAKTVNLVFESANPVEEVILTVDLPMGVELAGYPGRMQMRWATSLQAGKNRLPLELIAIDGMGGELIATMRSANTEKVFRIEIDVVDG
jgi:hypothetical protein